MKITREIYCPNCGKETEMTLSLRECRCECGYTDSVWWLPMSDEEAEVKAQWEAEESEELLGRLRTE